MRFPAAFLAVFVIAVSLNSSAHAQLLFVDEFETVRYTPAPYDRALRNPMKGLTESPGDNAWATLRHRYIRWNELENDLSDGLDRILQVSNQKFAGGAQRNLKFIPRVYLHWSADDQKYWPADMQQDDYTSEQFQARVVRLIERLGVAWNGDPRVAYVELGIFGKWGEHHSPSPTPEMQQRVGQAFVDAFPDKKVSVRHVWNQFEGFGFGEYWDSWAHYQQMWPHGDRIAQANQDSDLYLSNYIGGEVAYGWGLSDIQPGSSATDSVSDPVHWQFVVNSIRWLHATQFRWIADYDENDPATHEGAEQLQRALGYRFVLENVDFDPVIYDVGLNVEFSLTNEGSAPFYYPWPVEVALLDPVSREPLWVDVFPDVDIRNWVPGRNWTPPQWEDIDIWPFKAVVEGWSSEPTGWTVPAPIHTVSSRFFPDVPPGQYVLTLAILDPAGLKPSLRFATAQYWNGGRHPIGMVGVGQAASGRLPSGFRFDSPAADDSLHYDPD